MRGALLSFMLCVSLCHRAFAQGNDLSTPTGGRSALMGNTGVALARDGAAPFANPATIVNIRDQRLAFSVNFYSVSLTRLSHWHQPGPVDSAAFGERRLDDSSLMQSSFRSLPSTLCLFFTLADLERLASPDTKQQRAQEPMPGRKLAVCFGSLESEDVDLQAIKFNGDTGAGPTAQVQVLQRRWARNYLAPSYALHVGSRLAFGASLQGIYTRDAYGVTSNSLSADLDMHAVSTSFAAAGSGFSVDASLLLGATYELDALTLGASVRLPALHLFGHYTGTLERSVAGSADDMAAISSGSGSLRAPPPLRIAVGGGWQLPELTLELDAAVVLPVESVVASTLDIDQRRSVSGMIELEQTQQRFSTGRRAALNPSAGAEWFFTPSVSVLGGLSANFSTLGTLTSHAAIGNLVQARMNHVTASLGLGSYGRDGELLFGFQLDYGWGQALAANPYVLPNDWALVHVQNYALTFVISGAAKLRSLAHLVKTIASPDDAKPGS